MKKPVIIAICGKSASGKDTLAKSLYSLLKQKGFSVRMIVSDTTRPARINEIDGKDYNFISNQEFQQKIKNYKYLEWTEFRGWFYGSPCDNLYAAYNIGVFNFQGIERLIEFKDNYTIIPILLKDKWWIRLKRSIKREHKFSFEYIRRLWVDFIDFKRYKKSFYQYPDTFVIKGDNYLNRANATLLWLIIRNIL